MCSSPMFWIVQNGERHPTKNIVHGWALRFQQGFKQKMVSNSNFRCGSGRRSILVLVGILSKLYLTVVVYKETQPTTNLPRFTCYRREATLAASSESAIQTLQWRETRTCLCLGSFEQITYTLPLRITILQPSHITLTDDLTFIPLVNARAGGAVGAT